MAYTEQLPEYLLAEWVSDTVLLGPRVLLQVFDPVGTPQSLAAGTTIRGLARLDASGSVPAFTTPGMDIQVGPDEALLIEELGFTLTPQDASGKLQISNFKFLDSYNPLPLSGSPTALPYTFAPIANDTYGAAMQFSSRARYIRATYTIQGNFSYNINAQYILTNLDVGAAHTYTRILTMIYRRISGIGPLVPRVLSKRDSP